MAVVRIRYEFSTFVGTVQRNFAAPFVAPQLTLDRSPAAYTREVAFGATETLWDEDAGGGNPADFLWLALRSDIDVLLEFTHEANASTTLYSVFTLAAGVPFLLGSNVSKAGTFSGDGLANGTTGRITKIRAKNVSADTAAFIDIEIGA